MKHLSFFDFADSANKDCKLPIVIGKDENEQIYVDDLRNLRNILIGGATAQGKTSFLRSILTSLTILNSSDELKVALIDLKGYELENIYDEESKYLFHGFPRITTLEETSNILNVLNDEIYTRLNLFKSVGVRNIEDYNNQLQRKETHLPYVVVAIDELAELLIPEGNNIAKKLGQIVSKCYMTGIYVIATTIRSFLVPSMIKPFMTTRICFRCVEYLDSIGILDRTGAEKLKSQGELLFYRFRDGVGLRKLKAPQIGYGMKGPDNLYWKD